MPGLLLLRRQNAQLTIPDSLGPGGGQIAQVIGDDVLQRTGGRHSRAVRASRWGHRQCEESVTLCLLRQGADALTARRTAPFHEPGASNDWNDAQTLLQARHWTVTSTVRAPAALAFSQRLLADPQLGHGDGRSSGVSVLARLRPGCWASMRAVCTSALQTAVQLRTSDILSTRITPFGLLGGPPPAQLPNTMRCC